MQSDIFTHIDSSPASAAADGPLAGKSVAIQSNMSVRGWPTEAGSGALEDFVALEDATVVKRLREAGAIIKGSTRMSELGLGLAGDRTAQALARRQADIVLITDTMGEARVAAASIEACGFKPSYGLVSRFGLVGLVPSMECFGILAQRAEDVAAVMGVIAGNDDHDLSMPELEIPDFSQIHPSQPSDGVLGIIREGLPSDAGGAKAFRTALSRLEQAGLKTQEVSLAGFDLARTVHNVIGSVEASSSAGKYDGVRYGHRTASAKNWNEMYLRSRAEAFGLLVKTYLFQGAYFQFKNYAAFENACRIRSRLVRQTMELFRGVDALLLPTRESGLHPAPVRTINEMYELFSLTLLANVTGQPSLQVPGLVPDLGLQLIGPRLSDARLLSIAAGMQQMVEGGQ